MIGYKKRPSGIYANEAPLIASRSLNVTLSPGENERTSLASIFSDLDSHTSDNESMRAGHTAVLKCELFKKTSDAMESWSWFGEAIFIPKCHKKTLSLVFQRLISSSPTSPLSDF